MARGQKLFYGTCAAIVLAACGLVGNADFEDAERYSEHQKWLSQKVEDNEEVRPNMITEPQFVGRPSAKFYDEQFSELSRKYQENKRSKQ